MGSRYKKEIFNEHVQKGVLVWAKTSKRTSGRGLKGFGAASKKESTNNGDSAEPSVKIEMAKAGEDAEVVGNIE
jgi:mlo protein